MITATQENTTIGLGSFLKDCATYNAWVSQTIVNWLKDKPATLFTKEVASSFPSLRETLIHIWDTERFWYSVISKTPAPESFRMTGFNGSLEEIMTGFEQQSKTIDSYIRSLTEEELTEEVHFYTPWVEGTQTRVEFLYHCITHSAYHRGQLVTIGRQVGITDAPMTDYNFYLLMVKGKAVL